MQGKQGKQSLLIQRLGYNQKVQSEITESISMKKENEKTKRVKRTQNNETVVEQ